MKQYRKSIKEHYKNEFSKNKKLYCDLEKEQKPHTLIISCVDSRVMPSKILNSKPGQYFIIRNMGNIVPPSNATYKEALSTLAGIEYAVKILKIKNIIILGHSNCGACDGIYHEDKYKDTIYIKNYLQTLKISKAIVDKVENLSEIEKYAMLEKQNVILQVENLKSHSFITKEIKVQGWYYIIHKGEILYYNESKKVFIHH